MSLMLTNISQRLSQSQKMQILLRVQERRMSSLVTATETSLTRSPCLPLTSLLLRSFQTPVIFIFL